MMIPTDAACSVAHVDGRTYWRGNQYHARVGLYASWFDLSACAPTTTATTATSTGSTCSQCRDVDVWGDTCCKPSFCEITSRRFSKCVDPSLITTTATPQPFCQKVRFMHPPRAPKLEKLADVIFSIVPGQSTSCKNGNSNMECPVYKSTPTQTTAAGSPVYLWLWARTTQHSEQRWTLTGTLWMDQDVPINEHNFKSSNATIAQSGITREADVTKAGVLPRPHTGPRYPPCDGLDPLLLLCVYALSVIYARRFEVFFINTCV